MADVHANETHAGEVRLEDFETGATIVLLVSTDFVVGGSNTATALTIQLETEQSVV